MRAVAEQVIAGELDRDRAGLTGPDGAGDAARAGSAVGRPRRVDHGHVPADRRQLADLPGVLRAARPTWPRRRGQVTNAVLRVHVDAHQPAARPQARRTSPWPSTGPSRRSATRRSPTTRPTGPRRPTSCASRWAWSARWSRRSASRCSSWPASRPTTSSPRSPPGPRPRRRRASSSPATATATSSSRTPTSRSSTTSAACRDYALYDEAGILERTGVTPAKYVEYAALRGDTSDNLPGVPGVGEKTAAKLINTYGGLDGIFEHLDEQTPKLRANLAEHEAQVRQNAERHGAACATSRSTSTPDDLAAHGRRSTPTRSAACSTSSSSARLLRAPGRGARHRRPSAPTAPTEVLEAEVHRAAPTPADAVARPRRASRAGRRRRSAVAGAGPGAEGRSALEGLALVVDPRPPARSPGCPSRCSPTPRCGPRCAPWCADGRPAVAAHGAKALHARPAATLGVDVPALALDTAIAAYLLDPAEARYLLDELLARYAAPRAARRRRRARGPARLRRRGDGAGARRRPPGALAVDRARRPAQRGARRAGPARAQRRHRGPAGAGAGPAWRTSASASTPRCCRASTTSSPPSATSSEARSARTPASEFNVNSTPQLREVLFDELGLTPQKKTKTGYSTDAASLEKLAGQHPIIEHLLRYREVEKLRVDLRRGAARRGRAPTGASTPRSTRPWPAPAGSAPTSPTCTTSRCAPRRAGRSARPSSPPTGCELLVADYNQIELRCIAHLAEDPGLIAAFESGTDIHTETAARGLRRRARRRSTLDQRSKAKMVSYGLAYGMEAYGLGQRLEHPHRGGARHPRRLLRRLPDGAGLHGPDGRRGPGAGLHRDPVRPPPPDPRAVVVELPHPPGGRAPGHERRHPGPGRRHLQGRAGAARPGARGARASTAGSSSRCTTR